MLFTDFVPEGPATGIVEFAQDVVGQDDGRGGGEQGVALEAGEAGHALYGEERFGPIGFVVRAADADAALAHALGLPELAGTFLFSPVGFVLAWIVVALTAPLIAPYRFDGADVTIRLMPPSANALALSATRWA